MKKSTFSFLLLFSFSLISFAQKKQREAGIQFNDLDSFGLVYRTGTDKSLWRFNLLSSSFGKASFGASETDAFSIRASIGKEYRTIIDKNFEFRYGFDLGFGYANQNNSNNVDIDTFDTTANAVVGFNYVVNNKIVIGAEVLPSLTYRNNNLDDNINEQSDNSWFFSLNSNAARLSLAYRF